MKAPITVRFLRLFSQYRKLEELCQTLDIVFRQGKITDIRVEAVHKRMRHLHVKPQEDSSIGIGIIFSEEIVDASIRTSQLNAKAVTTSKLMRSVSTK